MVRLKLRFFPLLLDQAIHCSPQVTPIQAATMLSLRITPLFVLASSFFSTSVAQDGFTWWVNPNSTDPIIFQEGQTVTLQWVTDFPEFNIVLYQNLGDSYGEFASGYLLGKTSPHSKIPNLFQLVDECTNTPTDMQ